MRRACRVIGHNVLVAARSLASSREDACARTPAPQRLRLDQPHREDCTSSGHSTREARFNLIESIAPDQNGLNDHRWGVSPDRQQASSWSWSIVPLPRFWRRRSTGVYLRLSYPRLCSRPRRRVVSKLGQALLPPINVARNSPAISSNVESISLELQRFRVISKNDRGEITCEMCLEVVGSPPVGVVARPVSRNAPVASDPPTSVPGCMSG